MKHYADVDMKRFHVSLSSRRALLNTIIALNPDTFSFDEATKGDKDEAFHGRALKWFDPILQTGPDRDLWQEATLKSMAEARKIDVASGEKESGHVEKLASKAEEDWQKQYEKVYW